MPTRTINLTDRLDRFVESSVSAGAYQNASEVVRDALRLLEQHASEDVARLARLRAAIAEGEAALAAGACEDMHVDDLPAVLAALDVTGR